MRPAFSRGRLPPDTAELTVISPTDHLYALPAAGNRLRVATSWAVNVVSRPIAAQLGIVDPAAATLTAEQPGAV